MLSKGFIIMGIGFLVLGFIILGLDYYLFGNPLGSIMERISDFVGYPITLTKSYEISNIYEKSVIIYNSTNGPIVIRQFLPNGSYTILPQRAYGGYYIAFVSPSSVLLINNYSHPVNITYVVLPIGNRLVNFLLLYTIGLIIALIGGVLAVIGIVFYIKKI